MIALPEIIDAAIIRSPQPDDVIVLRAPANTTAQTAAVLVDVARRAIGCKVVVITGDVELASFTGVVA